MNHMASTPAILSHLAALADTTRVRALRVLEQHELTVAELCSVLQLPQSTTSRHLKVLALEGWLVSRRQGTAAIYRMVLDDLDPARRRLWLLVRDELAQTPAAEQDERRVQKVLQDRLTKSQKFFATAAGQWDAHRSELFGQHFDLLALPALVDPNWIVGDLGCGTGQIAATIAPFVRQVIAVDSSNAMLKAARARLSRMNQVQVRRGELSALPLEDESLDAAIVSLVLHHLPEPAAAIRDVARVLKPSGRLLLVDMLPHDHREYQQTMGHVWLGFEPADLEAWCKAAGLTLDRFTPLPVDAAAKGPALFAAIATRSATAPIRKRKAPQAPITQ